MLTTNSTAFFKQIECTKSNGDLIIIAYKLQTPENIGSIIRLAGNINCSKVIFLNPGKLYKEHKIKRVGGRSTEMIDWQIVDSENPFDFVPTDYQTFALETFTNATNIYKTNLPSKMVLLVGSENDGLPISILEQCQGVVYIPLSGKVQSMNVSQATAVAAFEWVRQMQES
ncbi:MAG: TrmH family RNA methyltransferase [Breznakibacter sp.]|jgi:23S rRNA (guanosine2251-2'-O)-methyltransferase|nr:TrmH family RNA methyltransferase [Breznakibacter sp.]